MIKDRIILDLCGHSGEWSRPYKEAGYDVRIISLPDNDVRTYEPPESVWGVFAAPPCTEFSVANETLHRGDRDAGLTKQRDVKGAFELVWHCLRIINKCNPAWSAIENPTGLLRDYLGKPRLSFQPWEYGDPWTKRTDIWGSFVIPPKLYTRWEDVLKIPGLYIRPNRTKPSIAFLHKSACTLIPQLSHLNPKTDTEFRSYTPPGFAGEFYRVNP